MYMTDLTVWLLSILFFGKNGDTYNVGSDKGVSIKKLAKMINNLEKNNSKIRIKKIKSLTDKNSYIPSISKSKKKLNLKSKKTFLPLQKGDVIGTLSDIQQLKKYGYKPTTDIKLGISKFVSWFLYYHRKYK